MKEEQLRKQEELDYWKQILPPDLATKYIEKKAFEIPDIGTKAESPADTTSVGPSPSLPSSTGVIEETPAPLEEGNVEGKTLEEKATAEMEERIQDLLIRLQTVETQLKLDTIKEEILQDVQNITTNLQKELEELKERKLPVRLDYDIGRSHKEEAFIHCKNFLDKILIPLVDALPEYDLISTQITSTYDEGSIQNGIISSNVKIPAGDSLYQFKIEVPILNGVLQAPLYVTRGRKIIPLTREALYGELSTFSFQKVEVDDRYKSTPFSYNTEGTYKDPKDQKEYFTNSSEYNLTELGNNTKFTPHKDRR